MKKTEDYLPGLLVRPTCIWRKDTTKAFFNTVTGGLSLTVLSEILKLFRRYNSIFKLKKRGSTPIMCKMSVNLISNEQSFEIH